MPSDPYFIEAAARVLDVLVLFDDSAELSLNEVMRRLGLVKSTAFRLLYTLERKGFIERTGNGRGYRKRLRRRIGFVSISPTIPFVADVERGIRDEAVAAGLEVMVRHHEFDSRKLLADVDQMLSAGISLLVCYNPDEHASHVVADRCAVAGVPVIAITFPVPGARLFGVNNYRAGLAGGAGLAEQIARRWGGRVDLVVVLDIPGESPAQRARITGMVEGLAQNLQLPESRFETVKVDRGPDSARLRMRSLLDSNPGMRRIAVLSYNDQNALGAAVAATEAGRAGDVAILSQGAVGAVRELMRAPRSPLWAAVAHFPERFGARLIPLVMSVLRGEAAPATVFTSHQFISRDTMDFQGPRVAAAD